MIKDKLHTISDEDAIEVAMILVRSFLPYKYTFDKIFRVAFEPQDGVDSQEAVKIYLKATVAEEHYKNSGWKDKEILIELIEHDRYHENPYIIGFYKFIEEKDSVWKHEFLSNQIEGIEYLQAKGLI